MDRNNIEKIARNPEDRILLAKLWDKINAGLRKNIPANTCFLSPRELEMARFLFGEPEGLHAFGGYGEAERKMLVYLPEYLEETALYDEDSPCVCLRAEFYQGDTLNHRDFLGSLMGMGIVREKIGDILVGPDSADLMVLESVAEFLRQSWDSAGKAKLTVTEIPPEYVHIPEVKCQEVRDTVSSLRLDAVASTGFRMARGKAAELISGGRVQVNWRECTKPDKLLSAGDTVSARGFGKFVLAEVGGTTRKGRISIVVKRFV
jgi:RNA-binding protein YlmH